MLFLFPPGETKDRAQDIFHPVSANPANLIHQEEELGEERGGASLARWPQSFTRCLFNPHNCLEFGGLVLVVPTR